MCLLVYLFFCLPPQLESSVSGSLFGLNAERTEALVSNRVEKVKERGKKRTRVLLAHVVSHWCGPEILR